LNQIEATAPKCAKNTLRHHTIDDFLEGFPSVTRDDVIAFLEEAKNRLVESAT